MRDLYTLPGSASSEAAGQRMAPRVTLRPHESDQDYFARRAVEERAVALASPDPHSRGIHLDLAERYGALSAAIGEATDRIG